MSYILKGKSEAVRLDEQTEHPEYSLTRELKNVTISEGAKVLDAGCGSGVLCRFLEAKPLGLQVSGCDTSELSLKYAKEQSLNKSSTYFNHDIVNKPFLEKYNYIFNRLVAHHLSIDQYKKVVSNFYSALVPDGEVCIIDPDGLFLNLGTSSSSLLRKMEMVKNKFEGNLNIARYIPGLLRDTGFREIKWDIEIMDFNNEGRVFESKQWKERFENSLGFYVDLFGNEFEARLFFKEYLNEAMKDEVPMFYNKFIISAKR